MQRTIIAAASVWIVLVLPVQAADADALAISANIQARHLPFGTIIDPIFASATSDQIIGYTRCGDSAIWTGHYLAAEAFRYKVTQASDAENNVKNAVTGIQSLVDVTGTDLLARCLAPLNSPFAAGIQSEEAPNGIYTNSSAGDFSVGNTSRDEYAGVFFGLAVAYDLVDDADTQTSISQLVTRMLNFLLQRGWTVVMPNGSISTSFLIRPDQMLALLQVGQHVNPGQFGSTYSDSSGSLAATVPIPIGVDTASDDSYFKFNLDYINLYNLIRLENAGSSALAPYRVAYGLLRAHTAPHQNAFFDLIDRALNGADAGRENESLALLDEWLTRPRRDPKVDLNGVVTVCGSGYACISDSLRHWYPQSKLTVQCECDNQRRECARTLRRAATRIRWSGPGEYLFAPGFAGKRSFERGIDRGRRNRQYGHDWSDTQCAAHLCLG